jgi:nucleotide-binding universal stress UspA family protein
MVLGQVTRPQSAWIRDVLSARSAEILREARERARLKGRVSVQLESRDGDVAQAILDVARETPSDAIVVGKRGTGRVAGLLIGSVSQKLVSLANNVVIVVP